MTKTKLKPAAPGPKPIEVRCNVITRDQIKRLWTLLYCADSVMKLLDRSERIQKCECEAACFRDIEGPKAIVTDTAEKLEKLLYEIEGNPKASLPGDDMDLMEMELKEGGAR